MQLPDLQRQPELALNLRRIQEDDDQIYRVILQKMAHHPLILREAVQVVNSGQVYHLDHLACEG